MSDVEHRTAAETIVARCAIITLSDTRTLADDKSGDAIAKLLESAGHAVARREIIPDEPTRLRSLVQAALESAEIDAIICTGGTGVSRRDQTVQTIVPMFDRPLDGFGELFRMLSFEQVGPAAMLSRATAGIVGTKPIFLLPGGQKAVELAMQKLIVPELRHLLRELRK